jgi:hypothetical protein
MLGQMGVNGLHSVVQGRSPLPALDQAKQALRGHRQLEDLGSNRRQRIGERVGNRCRGADGPAFAHATEAADRRRRLGFEMPGGDRRHLACDRDTIIGEACGQQLAGLFVDDFLVEGRPDALATAPCTWPSTIIGLIRRPQSSATT